MTHYLIDFENIGDNGIVGIDQIANEDIVTIFYNGNSRFYLKDLSKLHTVYDRLNLIMMQKSGPNYLDFYLSATIGKLANTNPETNFVIISKDKGYESVIDFCNDNGYKCSRCSQIINYIIETEVRTIASCRAKDPIIDVESNQEIKNDIVEPTQENTQIANASNVDTIVETNDKQEIDEVSTSFQTVDTIEVTNNNLTPVEAVTSTKVTKSKETLPESVKKKVREALKKDNVASIKYSQIYKAFLLNNKKEYLQTLYICFEQKEAQNYYNKTLAIFKEFKNNLK